MLTRHCTAKLESDRTHVKVAELRGVPPPIAWFSGLPQAAAAVAFIACGSAAGAEGMASGVCGAVVPLLEGERASKCSLQTDAQTEMLGKTSHWCQTDSTITSAQHGAVSW